MTLHDIMVHYDPDSLKTAQPAPPICPRCGSHRTEIVGLSDDGRIITLRCNACGERSRIETSAGARATRSPDDGSDELDVMRIVGRALAQLPDAESRQRVLHWASERFQPPPIARAASASAAQIAVQAPPAPEGDQGLSIEGVESLFADEVEVRKAPARPIAVHERFESLVEGFVNDFQRVAVEWQSV